MAGTGRANQREESDRPICHRCGRLLRRGRGELYVVTIEAVADPEVVLDEPPADPRAEYERLVEQAAAMSERELGEQVHRRVVLTLCVGCYREWIEDPAG